jgi:hypothetical protein
VNILGPLHFCVLTFPFLCDPAGPSRTVGRKANGHVKWSVHDRAIHLNKSAMSTKDSVSRTIPITLGFE